MQELADVALAGDGDAVRCLSEAVEHYLAAMARLHRDWGAP